jgi:tetratricopeptide (TPR) repeat protein
MMAMPRTPAHWSFFFLFLVSCCLTALIYSNTLDSPWQLDDFDNITFNTGIHINDLEFDSLASAVRHTFNDGRINRPVSYLSFALNWYFGKTDPSGYHIANTAIHIITAIFLYLATLTIFSSPRLALIDCRKAQFISLLSTVLWMVNPIHTQAITYIVQRMASLAAMFYIAGLWCYLRGRLASRSRTQALWMAAALLAFMVGCGSKENAITLPVAFVLVELVFFQDLKRVTRKTLWLWLGATGCMIMVFGLGALLYLKGDLASILHYGNRYFTPGQRVLTEFRILVFYLSQIFYPVPTRLSIEHDIMVSTTLVDPWTTLPSIIAVFGLIVLSFLRLTRWPLFSFAVLFFFLNHAIESSVIGLELIFEHRNYLPSMFLFLPVAQGLEKALEYYKRRSRPMYVVIAGFVTLLLIGFGVGTYVRNQVWQSGKSLWEDAALKAPASSRPLHNLALTYYEPLGEYDKALELYLAALTRGKTNISQESLILNNMANVYYIKNDYQKAAVFWEKAAESYPAYGETRYRMALALARLGEAEAAVKQLTEVLTRHPGHAAALNLKGIVLLNLDRIDESLECFRQALKSKPNNYPALINLGAAFMKMGRYDKAQWFFKTARYRLTGEEISLLWMALLRLKSGDRVGADAAIDELSKTMRLETLLAWISSNDRFNLYHDGISLPEQRDVLIDRIAARLHARITESPPRQN